MTKNTDSVNGGAMPKFESAPATKYASPPLHRRLRRPDHHGQGRKGPAAALAGEARRGGCPRPVGRPDRPARPGHRRPQPPLVRAQLRPPDRRRPAPCDPPDHPLDGRHAGRAGQGNRRRVRGQVHAAVVVLGRGGRGEAHGPAPAQHAGRRHQEIRALHHQRRRQVDRTVDRGRPDLPDHPDRRRKGFLAGGQDRRTPGAVRLRASEAADRSGPGGRHERLQLLGRIRRAVSGHPRVPTPTTSEPRRNSRP